MSDLVLGTQYHTLIKRQRDERVDYYFACIGFRGRRISTYQKYFFSVKKPRMAELDKQLREAVQNELRKSFRSML